MESLQKQLEKLLDTYATEVRNKVDECCKDTAVACSTKLRSIRPTKRTKKYQTGWAVKEEASSRNVAQSTWVVWNKKYYYLTHLLEKGHAKRNGGRTSAYPHIKPVEKWAQDELPKDIMHKLGG